MGKALGGVGVVRNRCLANCFGLEDQAQMLPCLIRCDNAAAARSGDEAVTLSSEEYVARWGDGVVATAGACHSTTPCPPEYGSCAGWSSYSDCGDPFCGVYRYCCETGAYGSPSPNLPDCDFFFGDALKQFRERYQVCFNAAGQSYTQYQRISVVRGCGCW